MVDLSNWKGVPRPERIVLEGRYARLEPLDAERHGKDLLAAAQELGSDDRFLHVDDRFKYLYEQPPADLADLKPWLDNASVSIDPLFFAVVDKETGRAEGRQSFLRIEPAHGVIEIGNILWGPAIARTRVATEAQYLFAKYAFDTLGYRRYEWKCNNLNEPSKRAALRFGFDFEGVFRQHLVVKGLNRDTAWFAIIDGDWPRLKAGYEAWLRPENFDGNKQQKSRLTF